MKIVPFANAIAATETRDWLPSFTFEIDAISSVELDTLRRIGGVSVYCDNSDPDPIEWMAEFASVSKRENTLVLLEHRSEPRSRTRSYKGQFFDRRAILRLPHNEFEMAISGGYTHFVSFARLLPANAAEIAVSAGDASTAFLLSARTTIAFDEGTASAILGCAAPLPGRVYLNYASVLTRFCTHDVHVLRFGGYEGNGDWSIHMFMPHQDVNAAASDLLQLSLRWRNPHG